MQIKKGLPVSPGYAIGPTLLLETEDYIIPGKHIPTDQVEEEIQKFQQARKEVNKDFQDFSRSCEKKLGTIGSRIIKTHAELVNDPLLCEEICLEIKENKYTAAYAVSKTIRKKLRSISEIGDSSFAQRLEGDFIDVEKALIRKILKIKQSQALRYDQEIILVAHDLTPAQTISLDRHKIKAIITDVGGKTSHSAIIASAMGIPCIVALGDITTHIATGDTVIVDAISGYVITDPDTATLERYQALKRNYYYTTDTLALQLREKEPITRDKVRINIMANIEVADEIPSAISYGADGVGLFRTEFIFLNNSFAPSEEAHLREYSKAISLSGGRKIVIRTLDIGADKLSSVGGGGELNPFMGLRAIRLCFEQIDLFRTQLRAILKVSGHGNIHLLLPLICSVDEILYAKQVIEDIKAELKREKVFFDENLKIGMMVETPAAILTLEQFVNKVDFFSLGTNDLTAYTLAVDRTNPKVAHLFCELHPAVIRTIREAVELCNKYQKSLSVCGEMAANPAHLMVLLGLGIRSISVAPPVIPEIKKLIISISIKECQQIVEKISSFSTYREADNFLRAKVKEILPDIR